MRELLPLLTQPSRYLGIEQGSVHKDPATVSLRCALCFPDLYEVGMSHLGQKILYGIVNDHPSWWAERVYEPDAAACQILRDTGTLLATLESDTPLAEMDFIGFSITHELCYTDVLNILDLGGIPLRTKDRPEDLGACPLVSAGGGAALGAGIGALAGGGIRKKKGAEGPSDCLFARGLSHPRRLRALALQ